MDTQRICPNCQKPLAADVPMGLCPECLIKAAFATGADTGTNSAQPGFIPPAVEEMAKLFPQLEILALIGKGGMGAVYKARQKQLNRFVALKILPPSIGSEPGFAERFAREAQALAQLNHPNIVTLHEFGQTGGLHYFLMEFVDGVNLRQLLAGGRISSREALAIVPQICDALQFAHDQGIVHRDIKPENILLDRRGRVKVADFGLAKIMGVGNEPAAGDMAAAGSTSLTEAGKVMGTPQYMSPEQITTPGEVDHRADIYALGVVLYQMLTGELPGKRIEPPSKKVEIDVRLDEVVLRALEKKPELRYQQASVLKTQVEMISAKPPPGDATSSGTKPRASWWSWAPFASPQVREITAHLTEAEKKEALKLGGLFAVWNSATGFAPLFLIFFAPKPLGRLLAPIVFVVGILFYPTLISLQIKFLCSTEWARQQGYTVANLRKYSFSARNIWKFVIIFVALMLAAIAFQKWMVNAIIDSEPSKNLDGILAPAIRHHKKAAPQARKLNGPPFRARLPQAEVELFAISDEPWTNTVCWLPDGEPSAEPFPLNNMRMEQQAGGQVMRKIAFRIRNNGKHGVSYLVCRINPESGVSQGGSAMVPAWHSAPAVFYQLVTCPTNAKKMNLSLGIANGAWETNVTLPHDEGTSANGSVNDWSASYNAVPGPGGYVAVSCSYPRSDEWESRMVYVNREGKLIPIEKNPSSASSTEFGATLLVSSNEFAGIKEFQVQRRKYHWVEFQNVSLQSGYRTEVSVKDSGENAPSSSASNTSSSPFREYSVNRTYAQLARDTNIESPEQAAAHFAMGMLGSDPTTTLNRDAIDLPILPPGSFTVTMADKDREWARRIKPRKLMIYHDELAAVIVPQETNDELATLILGKRHGQWKVFLKADLTNTPSLTEAKDNFRERAPELLATFRQFPEQKSSLMEEAGKEMATNMTEMMSAMTSTMRQMTSQMPGIVSNVQGMSQQFTTVPVSAMTNSMKGMSSQMGMISNLQGNLQSMSQQLAAAAQLVATPAPETNLFSEYTVDRTLADLALGTNADLPEIIVARYTIRLLGSDPTAAVNQYVIDLPRLPAGAVNQNMSDENREWIRTDKVRKVMIYREELAAVFALCQTNQEMATTVLGKRQGKWKIWAKDGMPSVPSLAEAEDNFRERAVELLATFRQLPEQKSSLLEEAGDKGHIYVVQKGDTLMKISRQFGMSVADLKAMNPELASGRIKVGQQLMVYEKPPEGKNDDEGHFYIVQEGDTLMKISRQFGMSVADLKALNPELDSSGIRVGQKVVVYEMPPAQR